MTRSGIATVARQEFRLRIRAGRWRWLLAVWFAVLLGFTVLLRSALSSSFAGEELTNKGTVLYGGLMLFVLGLALLVVPALAAQSVNGDRERGTLATLQVTRLSAGEIATGKFVAAWGTAMVFLVLTLPLVGFAMTQKGVPFGRFLIVTAVLAVLLGTVCAVSLALSALLSRTSTSGVLAYLAVFTLGLGTLIAFGLATAVTTEEHTASVESYCPSEADLQHLPEQERASVLGSCEPGTQTYTTSRARPDRTWWLLAPNPFVILADAAPQLPAETPAQRRVREAREERGENVSDARDLDPLGQIGSAVRELRDPPPPLVDGVELQVEEDDGGRRRPVWPLGLAVNLALGSAALWLTARRLRTPTRALARGQRVA